MNNQIVLILIMFIISQLFSIIINVGKSSKRKEIDFYGRMLERAKKSECSDSTNFLATLIVVLIRLYFVYLAINSVMSFIKQVYYARKIHKVTYIYRC